MARSTATGITNAITLGEAHAIINAAENDRDRLLVRLLWTTGGRATEVLSLKLADVLDRDTLRLLNEKQRSNDRSVKVCFVPESVINEIEVYARANGLRANDWLFPGRDPRHHLTRQAAWKIVKKLAAQAGVFKLRENSGMMTAAWLHAFRHGAAVNMVRQGVSIAAIKDQLGHASLESTDVYARMFSADRREAIKTIRF